MGCGSSKSAVVAINTEQSSKSVVSIKNVEKSSIENKEPIDVKTDNNSINEKPEVKTSIIQVKNAFEEEDNISISKDNSGSQNSLRINRSRPEINKINQRDKSATSSRSMADSGVFDDGGRNNSCRSQRSLPPLVVDPVENASDRVNSGKSLSQSEQVSAKPPSGKKSSARKKLLRLEDDVNIDTSLNINQPDSGPPHDDVIAAQPQQNMTYRSKSRFGNLAFDIVLDTPETGNARKKPERLPALVTKQKKKKIKTRRDIDKKMEEAAARRKIQEDEKLLKAKQFQHFSICTPVEVFKPDDDDDDDSEETHVKRIHSAGKSQQNSLLPNSNDVEKSPRIFHRGDEDDDDDRETIVEPFRLDTDDEEETLNNNTYVEKVTRPAVAAC